MFNLFKKHCDWCNTTLNNFAYVFCPNCEGFNAKEIRPGQLNGRYGKDTKCSVCDSVGKSVKRACFDCCVQHPDKTHSNFYISNYKKLKDGETDEQQNDCYTCGAVRLSFRTKKDSKYIYYKRGSTKPVAMPFVCDNFGIDNIHALRRKCVHHWIVLLDRTHPGSGISQSLRGNSVARNLLDITDFDLKYMEHGHNVNWCVKCGNFNKFSPRLSKLPVKG